MLYVLILLFSCSKKSNDIKLSTYEGRNENNYEEQEFNNKKESVINTGIKNKIINKVNFEKLNGREKNRDNDIEIEIEKIEDTDSFFKKEPLIKTTFQKTDLEPKSLEKIEYDKQNDKVNFILTKEVINSKKEEAITDQLENYSSNNNFNKGLKKIEESKFRYTRETSASYNTIESVKKRAENNPLNDTLKTFMIERRNSFTDSEEKLVEKPEKSSALEILPIVQENEVYTKDIPKSSVTAQDLIKRKNELKEISEGPKKPIKNDKLSPELEDIINKFLKNPVISDRNEKIESLSQDFDGWG